MKLDKMICSPGKFDIPVIQQQPPFRVDLLDSNIMLFGSSMSGKTSFLKNLINILHKKYSVENEQIFILDFGGSMSDYRNMPLVSAYYDNSNEEYVKRTFRIMENILKENIRKLDGKNFREADDGQQPVHTTFLIDNFNAFIDEQRYFSYHEKFARLSRDGLSKGITIVITAAETKGITPYMGSFRQKIAFEMPQDKYSEIFISKTGIIGNNPGHGFANVTIKPEGITGTFKMNLPYEVLTSKPDSTAENSEFTAKLQQKFAYDEASGTFGRQVKKYRTFPKELTFADYAALTEDAPLLCEGITVGVGLDYVNFEPVTIDFSKSHVAAIYGKKEFGKTNLLNILLNGIAKADSKARFVFFDDGREQLSEIHERMKEGYDTVMINKFETLSLERKDGTEVMKKLSPLQQFYIYLNRNYIELDKKFMAPYYDLSDQLKKEYELVPDCQNEETPLTVFVLQSKQIYLNSVECRRFINSIMPQLAAAADERKFVFIFSDVQKISDGEQNSFFNNIISSVFLLDNIAEFASERGQRSIFGNMDVKYLKDEYARCELGDGYYYDAEADRLTKLKYIKADEYVSG